MARTDRTPIKDRFWPKVNKTDGCWLWVGSLDGNGYGQISRGGKYGGNAKAHRISFEIANGPLPADAHVLHRCDNPACVRPDHLFIGDHFANMQDMWAKGRGRCDGAGRRGVENGNHRLNDKQVQQIRQRHANGEPSRKLGREFGVSKTLVLLISKGSVWQHLQRGQQ